MIEEGSLMFELNEYGDKRVLASPGFGVDVASQRMDDLDAAAVAHVRLLGAKLSVFRPRAMDIGCGSGGMAGRLAEAGARVIAVDLSHVGVVIGHRAMTFIRGDMRRLNDLIHDAWYGTVSAIVCQRAIHYLPYMEAVGVVRSMAGFLEDGGKLFISASGLGSELGNGYYATGAALCERFAPLATEMADKHGIRGRVCLYAEEDMRRLLDDAGLAIEKVYSSPFGNVKAIAGLSVQSSSAGS